MSEVAAAERAEDEEQCDADTGTGRKGDGATGRRGDGATRGLGDAGKRGLGDGETRGYSQIRDSI
ncbi:MAG: hypothetical protein ND895_21720 [Pyrinomonadaceae bacterium]|nr:hypothetical protein [Pyrinomonadaceae bacterium]